MHALLSVVWATVVSVGLRSEAMLSTIMNLTSWGGLAQLTLHWSSRLCYLHTCTRDCMIELDSVVI